jgi:hypothetical protein
MKRMTKTVSGACLALLCAAVVGLASCKKDGNSNSGSSAVTLLTSSRWTFTGYQFEQPNGTWVNAANEANADKFTIGFASNFATSEIDQTNGFTTAGTWSFSSNNTVLTTTVGYDLPPAAYTVSVLTSSSLTLTMLNYPQGGSYIDERFTFSH